MSVNCRWCVLNDRTGADMLCDACREQKRTVDEWRRRGWQEVIGWDETRKPAEVFSCEVTERDGGDEFPCAAGYVCGYGATEAAAVKDANRQLA